MGTKELRNLLVGCMVVASTAIVLPFLTSCSSKTDLYQPDEPEQPSQPETPKEEANDFDFSTVQSVSISLNMGLKADVEMFTSNPLVADEMGNYVKGDNKSPFLTGRTKADSSLDITCHIPAAATDIYVFSNTIGAPMLMRSNISNGKAANFAEVEMESATKVGTRASWDGNVSDAQSQKGVYSNWATLQYTLATQDEQKNQGTQIKKEWKETIEATLRKRNNSGNVSYQFDVPYITFDKDVTIKAFFVSHGSNKRTNTLTFYTFGNGIERAASNLNGNKYITIGQNKNDYKLNVAMENLNRKKREGEGSTLTLNGSTTFPKGTSMAFVLLVNPSNKKTDKCHAVFSEFSTNGDFTYNFNQYTAYNNSGEAVVTKNVHHMMAFKLDNTHIALAFEDQPYHESRTDQYGGDFRDDIIILEVTPTVPADLPEGEDPNKQEEPEYVWKQDTYGVLGFEDLFPSKGDYDMNDVVMTYHRAAYYDETWSVVMLEDEFTFINNGASYKNAFGYDLFGDKSYFGSFNYNRSDIKSLEVSSAYKCDGQGLDTDLQRPIVMLFDNSQKVPVGTTFKVKTILNKPIDSYTYGTLNYLFNPFIVVKGFKEQNRDEVHPTHFTPTEKMNKALFGTKDDRSDPANGIYYVGNKSNWHPFAINITASSEEVANFKVPTEYKSIEECYPQFKPWYESNGTANRDWYNYPCF